VGDFTEKKKKKEGSFMSPGAQSLTQGGHRGREKGEKRAAARNLIEGEKKLSTGGPACLNSKHRKCAREALRNRIETM